MATAAPGASLGSSHHGEPPQDWSDMMHPILVQDLARQRSAAIDREADHRRLAAIARSDGRDASRPDVPGRLGRLALAVGRLRLARRGSAA
jgi:hypothetical protein